MDGFNTPALLFGLILLVASLSLFLFGRFKPELQRDSDNVYAVIGIVCSLILFSSAFSLSLGMSFQQLLMIGCLISLMWENIKNRQPREGGARRSIFDGTSRRGSGSERGRRPYEDDPRAARGVYRYEAELDDYDRFDDPRRSPRRLRGSETRRGYDDEFGDDPRRNQPPRRPYLEDSDSRRAREPFDEFGDRPDRRPPRREPPADSRDPRDGGRRDDWVDPPERRPAPDVRPAREGRGEGRRGRRPTDGRSMDGRPMDEGRPAPDDVPPPRRRPRGGSMDGTPISLGERPPAGPTGDEFRGGEFGENPPNGSGTRAPGPNRPPMERPPSGRPPMERPPANRPPMDRPPLERPPANRPPMDRPSVSGPAVGSPGDRPPVGAAPSRGPQRNDNLDDDYVDFKPLTPPPDDEFDNSSNFDD